MSREFGRAVCIQLLAEIYLALDDLAQAEHYAVQVIQEEHVNTQPDGLRVLGEIRLRQGNLTDAETLINQSLEIARQNDDTILAGYALRSLAEVQIALSAVDKAQTYIDEAVTCFAIANLQIEVEKTEQILH